jgi:hypothetical protein
LWNLGAEVGSWTTSYMWFRVVFKFIRTPL